MNYFLQILEIAFLQLLVPLCCGVIVSKLAGKKLIQIVEVMLYGVIAMFAGFLVIAVVLISGNCSLSLLTKVWLGVSVGIVLFAIVVGRKEWSLLVLSIKSEWKFLLVTGILAVLSVLFVVPEQYSEIPAIVMRTLRTDALYVYEPYMGFAYGDMPGVFKYAPLELYYAVIAKVTGLHPLIVLNVVQPFMLIPICYMGYSLWGSFLFAQKRQVIFFVGMITLINCYPVLTGGGMGLEVFSGVWQRDTLLCSMILPTIILICLKWIYDEETNRSLLFLMASCAGAAELVMYKAVFYVLIIIGFSIGIKYIGRWKQCRTS